MMRLGGLVDNDGHLQQWIMQGRRQPARQASAAFRSTISQWAVRGVWGLVAAAAYGVSASPCGYGCDKKGVKTMTDVFLACPKADCPSRADPESARFGEYCLHYEGLAADGSVTDFDDEETLPAGLPERYYQVYCEACEFVGPREVFAMAAKLLRLLAASDAEEVSGGEL